MSLRIYHLAGPACQPLFSIFFLCSLSLFLSSLPSKLAIGRSRMKFVVHIESQLN